MNIVNRVGTSSPEASSVGSSPRRQVAWRRHRRFLMGPRQPDVRRMALNHAAPQRSGVGQLASGFAADAFLPGMAVDRDAGSLGGAFANGTAVVLDTVLHTVMPSPTRRSSPSKTR